MSQRTITVEHDGQTYYGQLGTIRRTSLGFEDHGILSAHLHVEWPGGGVGVGGYCLDQPKDRDGGREGTAYGLDHIIQVIETVGVSSWEKLTGQHVIVLFNRPNSLGLMSQGIAGVTNDKVLVLKAHADAWREAEAVAS